jgi:Translation initiation factor IF-2, N-terminal region
MPEYTEHDFMKRGYLLPEGCKDLIDVWKQPPKPSSPHYTCLMVSHFKQPGDFLKLTTFKPAQSKPLLQSPAPLPPIIGELVIPNQASVSQLAALLGQKVFQIIADVMRLGFFATPQQALSFEIISRVARRYGFIAIKTA